MLKEGMLVRICALGASAGLCVGTLSGCGEDSEAGTAVHEASLSIGSISAGAGTGSTVRSTVERLEAAEKHLSSGAMDGTDAQKAAVVILKSRAEAGLAAGNGLQLAELERGAVERMAEIRSLLRKYETLHARAQAETGYDPSQELDALAQESKQLDDQIAAATTAKRAVDQKMAGLKSQMDELTAQANAEQDKAAELQLQGVSLSAVEAAKLEPQIQEHAQSAEKKLLDVARLQGKVDQLSTEATEAALNLQMLSQQKKLNEEAQADIRQLQKQSAEEAEQLRAEANQAAQELRSAVEALVAFRTQPGSEEEPSGVDPLSDQQIQQLQSAVNNAKQGSQLRTGSRAAMGAAHAQLGHALNTRARSLADYAWLMDRIAHASPAVPDASWYAQKAEQARQQAEDFQKQANEALLAAADDYSAVGGRGESGDLMNTLVERLRQAAGQASPEDSTQPEENAG